MPRGVEVLKPLLGHWWLPRVNADHPSASIDRKVSGIDGYLELRRTQNVCNQACDPVDGEHPFHLLEGHLSDELISFSEGISAACDGRLRFIGDIGNRKHRFQKLVGGGIGN